MLLRRRLKTLTRDDEIVECADTTDSGHTTEALSYVRSLAGTSGKLARI